MLRRVLAPLLMAFAATNLGVWAVVQGARLREAPVDVQTRELYTVRLAALGVAVAHGRVAAFTGDSLIHGAHLEQERGADWARHTLAPRFAAAWSERDARPAVGFNLGIDGVLYDGLGCVVRDMLALAPEVLIVDLSPRPLSSDFAGDGGEGERSFLCPDPPGADPVERAGSAVRAGLGRALPVLRYRDLLQFAWAGGPPRVLALDRARAAMQAPAALDAEADDWDDEDAEDEALVAGMLWRLKAAQRYNGIRVHDGHPQAAALRAMLRRAHAQSRTRVLFFYLRENVAAIEPQLDLPHYEAESARFVRMVRAALTGPGSARFVEIGRDEFAGAYTDHIHLSTDGYARLAARLLDELAATDGRR